MKFRFTVYSEGELFLIIAFKEMSRKFINMVALHMESIPLICLFDKLFSCQCPFKVLNKLLKWLGIRRDIRLYNFVTFKV
jgi:hypothetical protein